VLSQLTWFDRQGNIIGTAGPPGSYLRVDLSPDGERVATVTFWGDVPEYRVMEKGKSGFQRIARGARNLSLGGGLLWSLDNTHLLYHGQKIGEQGTYLTECVASPSAESRTIGRIPDGFPSFVDDVSPDGKYVLYWNDTLFVVPLGTAAKPPRMLEIDERTFAGMFSPDGGWVVYLAGNPHQVFEQRFPDGGPRRQISVTSARMPFWRGDGREILYLGDDSRIWSVPVNLARGEFGTPAPLFQVRSPPLTRVTRSFGATRDGSRILFSQLIEQPESKAINVAIDWEAGIQK
jgi:hypothetical protein